MKTENGFYTISSLPDMWDAYKAANSGYAYLYSKSLGKYALAFVKDSLSPSLFEIVHTSQNLDDCRCAFFERKNNR